MQDRQSQLRSTFLKLIAFNEVYPYEDQVISYVRSRLEAAGVSVNQDEFGNIIARRDGSGEPVMLSTHVDIPEPAPNVSYTETETAIIADGTNILGADPKTGLAIILELCDALADHGASDVPPLELLLTRGEEAGLIGARNLDYSMVAATQGLVLDEDGPVTQVVTKAPGFVWFDAAFHGKTVHPREPEQGINALTMLAAAIEAVPPGYSTDGVTWNPGMVESGTARNSVPGEARVHAELRSFDTELAQSEGKRIADAYHQVAADHGGSASVTHELLFPGYHFDQESALYRRLAASFECLEKEPNFFATFGGSDANIFNGHGISCVPVGSGYHYAHQYNEEARIDEMQEILEFVHHFLRVDSSERAS
jgi:tripeptide aminopeptidase